MKYLFFIFVWLTLLVPQRLHAQSFDFDEEETDSNETSSDFSFPLKFKVSAKESQQIEPGRSIFRGLSIYEVFDYTRQGFRLRIEGTGNFNNAFRSEDDPDEVIDKHELEFIPRELFLSKTLGNASVSLGRQIKSLGSLDLLSQLDIAAPQDSTQLFFVDPEQSRIGQDLLAVAYFTETWQLWFGYAPKPLSNREPEAGHPYGLPSGLVTGQKNQAEGPDWYLEIKQKHSFGEFSILVAKTHRKDSLLVTGRDFSINLEHPDYQLVGLGYLVPLGSILLKTEWARSFDFPDWEPGVSSFSGDRSIVDFYGIGFDWFHDVWGQLIIEFSDSSSRSKSNRNWIVDRQRAAISWSNRFIHDQLTLGFTGLVFEEIKNRLGRIDVNFELTEDLSLDFKLTSIAIESNDPFYAGDLESFDRFDVGISWSGDFQRL